MPTRTQGTTKPKGEARRWTGKIGEGRLPPIRIGNDPEAEECEGFWANIRGNELQDLKGTAEDDHAKSESSNPIQSDEYQTMMGDVDEEIAMMVLNARFRSMGTTRETRTETGQEGTAGEV